LGSRLALFLPALSKFFYTENSYFFLQEERRRFFFEKKKNLDGRWLEIEKRAPTQILVVETNLQKFTATREKLKSKEQRPRPTSSSDTSCPVGDFWSEGTYPRTSSKSSSTTIGVCGRFRGIDKAKLEKSEKRLVRPFLTNLRNLQNFVLMFP